MADFTYFTPTKVYFGNGMAENAGRGRDRKGIGQPREDPARESYDKNGLGDIKHGAQKAAKNA